MSESLTAKNLLVVDLGTTYFKAAVVDPSGQIRSLARAESPVVHESNDRSEMNPDAFRDVIRRCIRSLETQTPGILSGVDAMTFSTQANTFILLDAADRPLTPFLIWNDDRACDLDAAFLPLTSDPAYSQTTGLPRLSHQMAICKLLWLSIHSKEIFRATRRICFLGDYLTRWFTGGHITDGSVAALSSLFDVPGWKWSNALCEKAGVPIEWLPPIVRAGTEVGVIDKKISDELGLPTHCRFLVGGLDQYAGAVGVGNIRPGLMSETTGTVLCTVRCVSSFAEPDNVGVFRGPGFRPGLFFHMVFGDISANLLEYYRNSLNDHPEFESLDTAAENADARDRLPLDHHLPPLELRNAIDRLAKSESRGTVVRCIYEVVARALAEQVHALAVQDRPTQIFCAGGGARSRTWLQVKADMLGIAMIAPQNSEPTLSGAALLAADALGWASLDSHFQAPRPGLVVTPHSR